MYPTLQKESEQYVLKYTQERAKCPPLKQANFSAGPLIFYKLRETTVTHENAVQPSFTHSLTHARITLPYTPVYIQRSILIFPFHGFLSSNARIRQVLDFSDRVQSSGFSGESSVPCAERVHRAIQFLKERTSSFCKLIDIAL